MGYFLLVPLRENAGISLGKHSARENVPNITRQPCQCKRRLPVPHDATCLPAGTAHLPRLFVASLMLTSVMVPLCSAYMSRHIHDGYASSFRGGPRVGAQRWVLSIAFKEAAPPVTRDQHCDSILPAGVTVHVNASVTNNVTPRNCTGQVHSAGCCSSMPPV